MVRSRPRATHTKPWRRTLSLLPPQCLPFCLPMTPRTPAQPFGAWCWFEPVRTRGVGGVSVRPTVGLSELPGHDTHTDTNPNRAGGGGVGPRDRSPLLERACGHSHGGLCRLEIACVHCCVSASNLPFRNMQPSRIDRCCTTKYSPVRLLLVSGQSVAQVRRAAVSTRCHTQLRGGAPGMYVCMRWYKLYISLR